MALMIRFATTIKVGNPRPTRRCVRSSAEFYKLFDLNSYSWDAPGKPRFCFCPNRFDYGCCKVDPNIGSLIGRKDHRLRSSDSAFADLLAVHEQPANTAFAHAATIVAEFKADR